MEWSGFVATQGNCNRDGGTFFNTYEETNI